MKLLYILVGFLVLLPQVTWAADGDACEDGTGKFSRGTWRSVACINLCDDIDSTDTICATFDLNSVGMPDVIVFEYEDVGGQCSSTPDFTITTSPESDGTPAYDLDASAVVLNSTTDRVVIDTSQAPLDRYIVTAVSDVAACQDVDIRMHLLDRRDGP